MTGKTCVVTGGAGSIGLASATLLLQEGANVMLVGRNRESLAAALESVVAKDPFDPADGRRRRPRRRGLGRRLQCRRHSDATSTRR